MCMNTRGLISKSDVVATLVAVGVVVLSLILVPHDINVVTDRFTLLGLLAVAITARLGGVRWGVIAAVATVVLIALLEQRPESIIAREDTYVDLAVFLAIAVVMGVQTGRLRNREAEAIAAESRMSLLSQMSAGLVKDSPVENAMQESSRVLEALSGADTVVVLRAREDGSLQDPIPSTTVDAASLSGLMPVQDPAGSKDVRTLEDGALVVPLDSASRREGLMYVGPSSSEQAAADLEALSFAGKVLGMYLERRRLEETVARSEAAQEADRLKANLISSVSHSLKTPLAAVTAVVTNLQFASAATLPEEAIRDLRCAERDLGVLNDRISDILDLSRLETESWRPNEDWNDVGEVCLSAVSTFDDLARARIIWAVPSSLRPVRFDFVQIVRVLHHLLENALAYSDGAPVAIGASVDQDLCRIWVEDSGPGVDPGERDSIFETFRRGRAAGATQGTGLGLAIAQQVVDSHEGRILIEDVTPRGARFVVELPREGVRPDAA